MIFDHVQYVAKDRVVLVLATTGRVHKIVKQSHIFLLVKNGGRQRPAPPAWRLAASFRVFIAGFNSVFFGHPFAVLGLAIPPATLVIHACVSVHPNHSWLWRR